MVTQNKSLQATRDGVDSSAFAGSVANPAWLSLGRQPALLMRSSFLLIILFCAAAGANPVAPDPPLDAFISSEKLAVTIGPAEARFNGTFTFKTAGHVSSIEQTGGVARLQIPIWFPADARQSSAIASFWKAIDQSQDSYLIDSASKKAVEQAVELKVVAGARSLPASDLVISGRGGYGYTMIPKRWREPGYHVLLFTFMVSPRIMDSGAPITISYRQPLLGTAGRSSFFYIPLFEHLPTSVSLSETNHYSITLTAAPNCDLDVTNGLFKARVEPGQNVNLSPKHLQAIRVTVQSRANKSVQALGR
jgi:hypothetical protein